MVPTMELSLDVPQSPMHCYYSRLQVHYHFLYTMLRCNTEVTGSDAA